MHGEWKKAPEEEHTNRRMNRKKKKCERIVINIISEQRVKLSFSRVCCTPTHEFLVYFIINFCINFYDSQISTMQCHISMYVWCQCLLVVVVAAV